MLKKKTVLRKFGDFSHGDDERQHFVLFIKYRSTALNSLETDLNSDAHADEEPSNFEDNVILFANFDALWQQAGDFHVWAHNPAIHERAHLWLEKVRDDSICVAVSEHRALRVTPPPYDDELPDWVFLRLVSAQFDVGFGDDVTLQHLPIEKILHGKVTTVNCIGVGGFVTTKGHGSVLASFDDGDGITIFRTKSEAEIASISRSTGEIRPSRSMQLAAITRKLSRLRHEKFSNGSGRPSSIPFMNLRAKPPAAASSAADDAAASATAEDSASADMDGLASKKTPRHRKARENAADASDRSSKSALPFSCSHCEASFETERGLNIHVTRAHGSGDDGAATERKHARKRSSNVGTQPRIADLAAQLSAQRKTSEQQAALIRQQSDQISSLGSALEEMPSLQAQLRSLQAQQRTISHPAYDGDLKVGSVVYAVYDDEDWVYEARIGTIHDTGGIDLNYEDGDELKNVDPAEFLRPPPR